jgi:hypothetical protein
MYRLGGVDYPLRTVAQCKVCQSPYRFEVEQEIAAGRTYKRIVDSLLVSDPEVDLSVDNLKAHYRNEHMPLQQAASRQILERRATARGLDVAGGVDVLVDGMALAETVVQKTYEAIVAGEIKPDLKDGLAAARIIETFAPSETGADANAYAQAFMVYHEVAQQVMTGGQFEEFGRLLTNNPTLKALMARYSEGNAEAVEEVEHEVVTASAEQTIAVETQRNLDNDPGVG